MTKPPDQSDAPASADADATMTSGSGPVPGRRQRSYLRPVDGKLALFQMHSGSHFAEAANDPTASPSAPNWGWALLDFHLGDCRAMAACIDACSELPREFRELFQDMLSGEVDLGPGAGRERRTRQVVEMVRAAYAIHDADRARRKQNPNSAMTFKNVTEIFEVVAERAYGSRDSWEAVKKAWDRAKSKDR